jgi:hypothetical protein
MFLAAALAPAGAHASITVGSDFTLPADSNPGDCQLSTPPCTYLMGGAHAGNQFPAESPTKGIVTSFRIKTGASTRVGETVIFRLGQFGPFAPTSASGAGTGPTVTLLGPGVFTVPAHLVVKPGDHLGIDTSLTGAFALFPDACPTDPSAKAFTDTFHPPLIDFGPLQVEDANGRCELLVQATIQPSSVFGFNPKQVYKVSKKFKIVLPIELPGPGGIKVSGNGLAKAGFVTRTVSEAGTVKLPLKLAAKKLRRLEAEGKGGLKVTVTFTPVGGAPGTQTFKLKLKVR